MYPKTFDDLIYEFQKLPGVGAKTAERYAFTVLGWNEDEGVLPDQLNIMSLLKRINENTEEVILALDPTVEGETTALYISKLLEGKCRVSRLAHGIPVGSHLDYTDAMTLLKAFEGRKSS